MTSDSFDDIENNIPEHPELFAAVNSNDLDGVQAQLEGRDANIRDDKGKTPLMCALEENNIDVAKFLLNNGAKVNLRDDQGTTSLMLASEAGHADIVEILLQAGANPTLTNDAGQTAIDLSSNNRKIKDMLRDKQKANADLLGASQLTGEESIMNASDAINDGAWVDISDENGITALMHAAQNNNLEMVNTLLTHGADPTIVLGYNGRDVTAMSFGNEEIRSSIEQAIELRNDHKQPSVVSALIEDVPSSSASPSASPDATNRVTAQTK